MRASGQCSTSGRAPLTMGSRVLRRAVSARMVRPQKRTVCEAAPPGADEATMATPPQIPAAAPIVNLRPPEPPAMIPAAATAAAAPPLEAAAAVELTPVTALAADLLRLQGGLKPGGPFTIPKLPRRRRAQATSPTSTPPPTPPPTTAITDTNDSDPNIQTAEPDLKVMLLACCIGAATGFSVVLFNTAIHTIHDMSWEGIPLAGGDVIRNLQFSEPGTWKVVLITPALGGLGVAGLRYLAGGFNAPAGAEPTGLPANAPMGDRIRDFFRPALRAAAAAVTLGTGASLGPEGPSVDIGKSVSQGLSGLLTGRISESRRVALVAAGAAAGVAAGFNAVISGVFFAIENVIGKEQQRRLRDLRQGKVPSKGDLMNDYEDEETTIVLVLLAAVTAAAVVQAGLGSEPAFRVPTFNLRSPLELPLYFLLGALCGVVGGSFSASCRLAQDFYSYLASKGFPRILFPALGGLLTGAIALRYPEVTYEGFENVNEIMRSGTASLARIPGPNAFEYGPSLLIELVIVKVVTTALCRESGLVGGVFAPSIFLGASLGTGLGRYASAAAEPVTQQLFVTGALEGSLDWAPAAIQLSISAPQSYALVGLTAMLAAICRVPLTAIALLFELTRNYTCIVPAIGAVGLSFYISSLVGNRFNTAYDAWKVERAEAAAAEAAAASAASAAAAQDALSLGSTLSPPAAASPPSTSTSNGNGNGNGNGTLALPSTEAKNGSGNGNGANGHAANGNGNGGLPSVSDISGLDIVVESTRAEQSSLGRYIIVGEEEPTGAVLKKLVDSTADLAVVTNAEGTVLGLLGLEDVLAARVIEDSLLAAGVGTVPPSSAAAEGAEEGAEAKTPEVKVGP